MPRGQKGEELTGTHRGLLRTEPRTLTDEDPKATRYSPSSVPPPAPSSRRELGAEPDKAPHAALGHAGRVGPRQETPRGRRLLSSLLRRSPGEQRPRARPPHLAGARPPGPRLSSPHLRAPASPGGAGPAGPPRGGGGAGRCGSLAPPRPPAHGRRRPLRREPASGPAAALRRSRG